MHTGNHGPDIQHTLGHVDCPACEATFIELCRTSDMRHLKFRDAALLVLADEHFYLRPENASLVVKDKSLRVGKRTYSDHADFTRRLNRFFGEIVLEKIHPGHWVNYQRERSATAGPGLINHETSFLSKVLHRAGLWDRIKNKCPNLYVPKSTVGRSLTPEMEQAILDAAASRPRWQPFYFAALLMINTTANQGEIVHLRIRDLDMEMRRFSIREGGGPLKLQSDGSVRHSTKTPKRERELVMTDAIFSICSELLRRYRRICRRLHIEQSPDHYLFPGRARAGKIDPTRHVESFKRAWAGICKQAGITGVRIEDLRHHASTKLQENEAIAPGVVEDIMGHAPGSKTKGNYRHIREHIMRQALQSIEVKPVRSVETVDKVVQMPRSQSVAAGQK